MCAVCCQNPVYVLCLAFYLYRRDSKLSMAGIPNMCSRYEGMANPSK